MLHDIGTAEAYFKSTRMSFDIYGGFLALETVLDESRLLEIEEAMKELHVELEPEDLGPVVVRLRKGPDGTLDIGFRAREGDAARVLEQGTDDLRSRLFEAGFASVTIDVAHDDELRLTR